MPTRDGALRRAAQAFDAGGFRERLAALVAIPSTSQDPGQEAALGRYLEEGILPWLEDLGFAARIHPNPLQGFGPILAATRIEDPALPTILLYGHRGDN